MYNILKMLVFVGMAFTFSACNSNNYPTAPMTVDAPQQKADYKLGPLDNIQIFVWRSPELSTTVSIRPDGKISVPLIEDLLAAGKTSTELARGIEAKLKPYVEKPLVTVLVNNFAGSFDQHVRVVGQTGRPQAIPYRNGMTVLDVIISVGGLTEFADGNNAVLTRTEKDGKKTSYGLRLSDLVRSGDIKANVPVLPGDVIIIPESTL